MGGNNKAKRTARDAELRSPSPTPTPTRPRPPSDENLSLKDHIDQRINELRTLLVGEMSAKNAIIEELGNELKFTRKHVERLDREVRAPNMILYNVPETLGSAGSVKSLFSAEVSGSIVEVRRLGRHVAGARRPRAVLVKFVTVQAKHAAFKAKKQLRETRKIFLDDDLTVQQREARKKLLPAFTSLKQQGLKPFWRQERLMHATPEGVRVYTGATPQ